MKKKKKKIARIIPAPTPRSPDLRHRLPLVESVVHEPTRPRPPRPRPDFRPVEDLRHDQVDRHETFRTKSGRPARIETRPQGNVRQFWLHSPVYGYFSEPEKVLVCIRRATRARVLFALRKVGRGKRVSPRHRWTEKSYVRCK